MLSCGRKLAVFITAMLLFTSEGLHAQAGAAEPVSLAASATSTGWLAPNTWVLYGVPAFVLLASVIAITKIASALGPRTWSLADALSEEVMMPAYTEAVPATEGTAASPRTLILDNDRKAVLVPELHASVSRVIAMMGMMAILFLFLGFGVFAIFEYGATGKVSDNMDRISSYLTTGLTLFAPYLVNQFSSIFKSTPGSK